MGNKWESAPIVHGKWDKAPVVGQKQSSPIDTYKPIVEGLSSPGVQANKAAQYFKQGDIPAGVFAGGKAGVQAGMELTGIPTGIRAVKQMGGVGDFIGSGLEGVMNLPSQIISGGANLIERGLQSLGVPQNVLNLGMSPQASQEGADLVSTVGQVALAPRVAKTIGEVAPKVMENIANIQNLSRITKAEELINKAAPPLKKELNRKEILKRAEPYLAEQQRVNPISKKNPESAMRQAWERTKDAMDNLWEKKVAPQVQRVAKTGSTINGNEISTAILQDLSDLVKNSEPIVAERIQRYADSFNREIPISEANTYIKELNAKTRNYQKATPEQKAMMESADPNIASKARAVEALRESVYNKLEQFGEKNVRDLRKDYGALKQVHDAFERNIVQAERQHSNVLGRFSSPTGVMLATEGAIIGAKYHPVATITGGILGLAREAILQRGLKNPMVSRAFKNLGKSNLQPPNIQQPDINIAGLLPPYIQPKGQIDIGSSGMTNNPQYVHYGVGSTPPLLPPSPYSGVNYIVMPDGAVMPLAYLKKAMEQLPFNAGQPPRK